jgi:LPS-assembly protein
VGKTSGKAMSGVRQLLPRALLLAASLAAVMVASHGAYAFEDIPFIKPVSKKPAAGSRVDVIADLIAFDDRSKIATATGMVKLTYGPYTLIATKVVYDQNKDILTANGSVVLSEPNGNVMKAEMAEIRNKFKEGFARHLKALLTNDVTITADYARRDVDGVTVFEHSSYTACVDCKGKNGAPLWDIVSDTTTHDANTKTLYFTNPKLRIAGHTVAWFPYLTQPDPSVKRRTGLLIPHIKTGHNYGVGLVTPYFIELGKSADLTLSPMWTTKQGPVADVEYRQRLASGLFNIHGYGVRQLQNTSSADRGWRGALASAGNFKLDDHWNWGWDGTVVSDRRFLDDFDFSSKDLLTNKVFLTGMADRNYFSAQALDFHTLALNEHQGYMPTALPYIDSEYTLDQAILGGELSMDWSAYSISREDYNTPFSTVNHGTQQTRAVSSVNWQRQMISDGGAVVTPFVRVRSDLYITDNLPDPTVPGGVRNSDVVSRILPSAGFDMRWPFIASFDTGQSVVTPVFQAVAATNETDLNKIGNEDAISINFDTSSLFLQDRFTGQDRFEGGSRINAGVLYSFLGENGGFARVSLGESFHVGGRNSFDANSGLSGTKSDMVGAVVFQPWDELSLNYQARVKEDLSKINTQEAFANYSLGSFSGSLGYLYLDQEATLGRVSSVKQIEGETTYKFDSAWSVFAGLKYDLIADHFLGKTLGVGFDCDCMSAKLSYTETQGNAITDKRDRTLRLSVDLRTIGGSSLSAGL